MQLLCLEEPWTLILDDALANSFVAPATDDIKDDHQLMCKPPSFHLDSFTFKIEFIFSSILCSQRKCISRLKLVDFDHYVRWK